MWGGGWRTRELHIPIQSSLLLNQNGKLILHTSTHAHIHIHTDKEKTYFQFDFFFETSFFYVALAVLDLTVVAQADLKLVVILLPLQSQVLRLHEYSTRLGWGFCLFCFLLLLFEPSNNLGNLMKTEPCFNQLQLLIENKQTKQELLPGGSSPHL